MIQAIAVTRARRLIAPRPTPLMVAIAATRALTRATLPDHQNPLYPPFARGDGDFAADSRNNSRTNGNEGQPQLFIAPASPPLSHPGLVLAQFTMLYLDFIKDASIPRQTS